MEVTNVIGNDTSRTRDKTLSRSRWIYICYFDVTNKLWPCLLLGVLLMHERTVIFCETAIAAKVFCKHMVSEITVPAMTYSKLGIFDQLSIGKNYMEFYSKHVSLDMFRGTTINTVIFLF